jgi:hypothetical protein
MNPWRSALLGGVTAFLALSLWLTGQLLPGPVPPAPGQAHRVLLWVQALAVALLLPAAAADDGKRSSVLAPLLLVMIPWPLLVLLYLSGGTSAKDLAAGQLLLGAWALSLGLSWRLIGRLVDHPSAPRSALHAIAILAPLLVLQWVTP